MVNGRWRLADRICTQHSEVTMSKTILVVEDSSSMRQVVGIALTRAGYEVLEAGDGVEGLTRLDGRKINLIISDVNMPRMDGITFVTQVKQHPRYKFTPVIMLTTEDASSKMQQGKVAGAKAWITKPFSPPVLLDAVARLVLP
jgi:two-component system chemotaxis response regulator CheY